MAQELKITAATITYVKNGAKITVPIDQLVVDVSGDVVGEGIISVATSAAALDGLPASPGLCFFRNTDATNFIQLGGDATHFFVELTPELPWAILPLSGTAIYAKADTAACIMQYKVFPL